MYSFEWPPDGDAYDFKLTSGPVQVYGWMAFCLDFSKHFTDGFLGLRDQFVVYHSWINNYINLYGQTFLYLSLEYF